MPDLTPAAELRAAAAKLLELAEAHAPAPRVPGVVRCTCGGCVCGDLHWPCASISGALAVARSINTPTEEQH